MLLRKFLCFFLLLGYTAFAETENLNITNPIDKSKIEDLSIKPITTTQLTQEHEALYLEFYKNLYSGYVAEQMEVNEEQLQDFLKQKYQRNMKNNIVQRSHIFEIRNNINNKLLAVFKFIETEHEDTLWLVQTVFDITQLDLSSAPSISHLILSALPKPFTQFVTIVLKDSHKELALIEAFGLKKSDIKIKLFAATHAEPEKFQIFSFDGKNPSDCH